MRRVLFALLFLGSLDAAQSENPELPLRVGAILPLTGDMALPGSAFLQGMQLAVEEALPRKVVLIAEDARNEPARINSAAVKLASMDRVAAVMTATYPQTMIGGKVFERNKTPLIALWDSSPEIDNAGNYIFAIGPWAPASGTVAASFSRKTLKAEKAVVIHTVEEWGEAVANFFKDDFEKSGGKVLEIFPVNSDNADFRPVLTKTKKLAPDVIYAPCTVNLVPFFRQAFQLQIGVPIVTSDNIAAEFIEKAPEAFEGAYQTMIQDPQTEAAKELLARYEKRFQTRPGLPWHIATGYDATKLILAAAQAKGNCAECIAKGLYEIRSYPGTLGPITINAAGSWPQMPRVFRVQNGQLNLVE